MKQKWTCRDIIQKRLPLLIVLSILLGVATSLLLVARENARSALRSNGFSTHHYTPGPAVVIFALPAFPIALLLLKLVLNIPFYVEWGAEHSRHPEFFRTLQKIACLVRLAAQRIGRALRWLGSIPARLRHSYDLLCVISLLLGFVSLLCLFGLDFLLPLGIIGKLLDLLNYLLSFLSLDAYVLLFGIPAVLLADYTMEYGAALTSLSKIGKWIAFGSLVLSFSPIGSFMPLFSYSILKMALGMA